MTKVIGPMPVEEHYLWKRWTNIRADVLHREVASDWGKHDFWDWVDYVEIKVGLQPSKEHKLIRKDVDKGWVQGNIKWADYKEAGRHYRNVKLYKIGKDADTVSGWARKYNINVATVFSRLDLGWTMKKALGIK